MSSDGQTSRAEAACGDCLRRGWLLSMLSGPLDCRTRDHGRLIDLLALPDRELLQALAGSRARELSIRYKRFDAGELRSDPRVQTICRHRPDFPPTLDSPAAPHMLALSGDSDRLAELTTAPAVAILGSRTPSDYGLEMARSLARGLSASGVTVVAGLCDGIAAAAHLGALDAGGRSVSVMSGGLNVSCPPRRRSLYELVKRAGCAVSELPLDCDGRRWGQLTSQRIVVELSGLAVVVEADRTPMDLFGASIACTLGRSVAAIPGRVTSTRSRGTHALLMEGASLVRGPADVLELLSAIDTPGRSRTTTLTMTGGHDPHAGLDPALRATLERVGDGCDTADKLALAGIDASQALLALSELELLGLLARGDGGRYLPRHPLEPDRDTSFENKSSIRYKPPSSG